MLALKGHQKELEMPDKSTRTVTPWKAYESSSEVTRAKNSGRASARATTKVALGIVLLLLVSLAGRCPPPPGGTKWIGDFSKCDKTQADATIQTIGGNVGGLNQEFGKVTPNYSGHPGCDAAYVLDYLTPPLSTNNNPGWTWAWMHVASRVPNLTPDQCNQAWTSLRVYAFWKFQGAPQQQLVLESYRKAKWTGQFCDFGIPDNVWISSAYERVRAVSQHGVGYIALQPHYSYFVTNNH
jgi:hypothetical protein